MSEAIERHEPYHSPSGLVEDEKVPHNTIVEDTLLDETENSVAERDLGVTEDDLLEAKEIAATYSLEDVRRLMTVIYKRHKDDQNFSLSVLQRIDEFLNNDDVLEQPEKHLQLINEMKIEAAIITHNSPYALVRAIVDNHDDSTLPVSTIRAWSIGIVFSAALAFVNAFFAIRLPPLIVDYNVVQLLSYPVGKLFERVLPDWGITVFGVRHSLNPGPFNKKEHMLIALMAAVSISQPYSNFIAWIQYLPTFFNQAWAKNFGYQVMIGLSTNLIGYGLAGICRRFLVYPSYCVWPIVLATVALNAAFHTESNPTVPGPFKRMWSMSRLKFFLITFTVMFCWFWIPNFLFNALLTFSWMTWISPNNKHLSIITGSTHGLGLNPIPTLDWSVVKAQVDPLLVPIFTTVNLFIGTFFFAIVIIGIYYTNAYSTAYLPINSNAPFDHFGLPYNISLILDKRGILEPSRYEAYSPPYISAGNLTLNFAYFATYSAALTYGILYYRREMVLGFKSLINSFRSSKNQTREETESLDVHNRLMKAYKEVPEWWYLIVVVFSIALGCAAIAHYPTHTTVGVVFFGVFFCLVFMIPTGIIFSMTGIEVPLNVLSEFIGGSWVNGNAVAICFFKTFGYVTCSHALHFSAELKAAHYLKIAPRFTFFAQMIPTIISTFVCVGVMQFQMNLEGVCTAAASFKFLCPSQVSFFTAAIIWGSVGPKRLWGTNGTYTATLAGFPVGMAVVLVYWLAKKQFPNNSLLRSVHPVIILYGGCLWAPYNLSYIWPAVPVACFSWIFLKSRYLGLWSKYNYILSAALASGIALSALIQFFALSYQNISVKWWGNTVTAQGCELIACTLKKLPLGETFGASPGNYA